MSIHTLTDEQNAFVEAIRDFAARECGTREQRAALTEHGVEPHNQAIYERIAELSPQAAYVHIQAAVERMKLPSQNGFRKLLPGYDFAGRAHQRLQ